MQTLPIPRRDLRNVISLPSSKSYANRALILAALCGNCRISNLPRATDVSHLLECLQRLGLDMTFNSLTVSFRQKFPDCEPMGDGELTLPIGEGGTTGRFLAALVLLGRRSYRLQLGPRLSQRPWEEFIAVANRLGASARLNGRDLLLKGPIRLPEVLEIDCSRTTQFATAFQLISLNTNSSVVPVHLASSQSYLAMTEKLVATFPVKDYVVPLDWSSASYPLAYGALNHEIHFPGLHYDPLQADAKFYDVLRSLGSVDENPDGIRVRKILKSKDIHLEVSDALDLVPTLAYFLGNLPGNHSLTGVENLMHKESDRLQEVISLLGAFGRETKSDGRVLMIKGEESRLTIPKQLVLPDDHRLVMAGTLFLLHHGGGAVSPSEAVAKSYPDFFSIISS